MFLHLSVILFTEGQGEREGVCPTPGCRTPGCRYGQQAGTTYPTEMHTCSLITTRKRSLRRLCFYRCLSVHRGGFSIGGGFSIWGGSPSGGGALHPGGGVGVLHPGGVGFSIPGGVLHPVNVRAVRILLECILVY